MLQDTLSQLSLCSEEKQGKFSKAFLNPAEVLKSCYYQIASLAKPLHHPQLPAIPPPHPAPDTQPSQLSHPSLSPRSLLFSNTLSPSPRHQKPVLSKSTSEFSRDSSSLLPIKLLEGQKRKEVKREKIAKENKFRRRTHKKRQPWGLNKKQRYFEEESVEVKEGVVKKMGLYDASNLFKAKNLNKSLSKLELVAHKHQFNLLQLHSSCDLFLTNLAPQQFCVQDFVQLQLAKENSEPADQDLPFLQVDTCLQEQLPPEPSPAPKVPSFLLTIRDYLLVEDEELKGFKAKHLPEWGTVLLNLRKIVQFLKQHRILSYKIQGSMLLEWEGRRNSKAKICSQLNLNPLTLSPDRVERQVLCFRDKLKVAVVKKRVQKRERLVRWVTDRLKATCLIRKARKAKCAKALLLQQELRRNVGWEAEVFIPSFSLQLFKRETTQYMDWFQSQYHMLWKKTRTPLVLVLPTLNEHLLNLFQSKLKLTRPVTIITPEVYSAYPCQLSLAAQVYFSYQTLEKISRAITSKSAVLIGGTYSHSAYELLISEYLGVPLLNSIKNGSQFQEDKLFFQKASIPVPAFSLIPPNTPFEELLRITAQLLEKFDGEKSWVIKIRGEFRGRGLATFKLNPNKQPKGYSREKEGSKRDLLLETLRTSLRLKLKVNFQNSVYMVDDFLLALEREGGIIEELLQTSACYELCFLKQQKCELQSEFRMFGTNYNNKVWLLSKPDPSLSAFKQSILNQITCQPDYLGYISVTIAKTSQGEIYGIDVKFGQTPAAGLAIHADALLTHSLPQQQTFNLSELPTRRNDPEAEEKRKDPAGWNHQLSCLFLPAFPFTDLEETSKAKLIQEMMHQCWTDRALKLGSPKRLFLSLGLDFGGILFGRDIGRLRREAGELVRDLAERSSGLRKYQGKEMVRDVFEFGQVVRTISQIKIDE